jgi:NADPH:quinone reductase-like Zn-dependent oxidoreductase
LKKLLLFPFLLQPLPYRLGLQSPENPYKENHPKLLVWGASTCAGMFAIQLAKLSGIRVVATAPPHSWALLQSLGAEAIFDYRDPEVSKKIKDWAKGELLYGLDCISDETTVPSATNSMTGGTICLLSTAAMKHPDNNKAVSFKSMALYTILGKEFFTFGNHFPANQEDFKWASTFFELCTTLVTKGDLRVPPLRKFQGLERYEDAFELLIQNKIKKCVLSL